MAAVCNFETDSGQFAVGSLPLLARRQDFVGNAFSNGPIVPVRRKLSTNVLERRRHVGERGLIELQHRDHVAAVGNGPCDGRNPDL